MLFFSLVVMGDGGSSLGNKVVASNAALPMEPSKQPHLAAQARADASGWQISLTCWAYILQFRRVCHFLMTLIT